MEARIVLGSIRVGGMAGRARDERLAISTALRDGSDRTRRRDGATHAARNLAYTRGGAVVAPRGSSTLQPAPDAGTHSADEAACDRNLRYAERVVPPHR